MPRWSSRSRCTLRIDSVRVTMRNSVEKHREKSWFSTNHILGGPFHWKMAQALSAYRLSAGHRATSRRIAEESGEGGIRTPVRVTPEQHFQCCAFSRSATSPKARGQFSTVGRSFPWWSESTAAKAEKGFPIRNEVAIPTNHVSERLQGPSRFYLRDALFAVDAARPYDSACNHRIVLSAAQATLHRRKNRINLVDRPIPSMIQRAMTQARR